MIDAQQIIIDFELQVSDITDLSTSEELRILNRVYKRICSLRPWEFLKKEATGSSLSDADGNYIPLPSDFQFLSESTQYTDNTIAWQGNSVPKMLFINGNPVKVVNYSDRRSYSNDTVAYIDLVNNKIRLTNGLSGSYSFDYIYEPADLALTDIPVVPSRFNSIFVYAMAGENDIIQLSDKAKSYQKENEIKYAVELQNLEYWNAQQRYD